MKDDVESFDVKSLQKLVVASINKGEKEVEKKFNFHYVWPGQLKITDFFFFHSIFFFRASFFSLGTWHSIVCCNFPQKRSKGTLQHQQQCSNVKTRVMYGSDFCFENGVAQWFHEIAK